MIFSVEENSYILDLLECCLDSVSMHLDRTVKIAITSHEVVHVRVLFLKVLQRISRKTQVIGVIILIPGRSQFTPKKLADILLGRRRTSLRLMGFHFLKLKLRFDNQISIQSIASYSTGQQQKRVGALRR